MMNEEEPYLILHKVRNQPAFDIAHKMPCPHCAEVGCPNCDELGYWWIVSTSGHGAHPFFSQRLAEILQNDIMELTELPADLPDHYTVNASPSAPKLDISALIAASTKPLTDRRF